MDTEWDANKDAENRRKHGYGLALGAVILTNVVSKEAQWVNGEERSLAFGLVGIRLFVCAYTMRDTTYRIISVRRATKQEERRRWLS